MNQLSPFVEVAPGETPTQELAQRRSGTVEVLLLWYAEIDRVEVSLHDSATDAGFHIEVPPGNALDAFYHPYAYAAERENAYHVAPDGTTILDG
jgi:hypothetical protein